MMNITTRASIQDEVFYMLRNKIEKSEVFEISIKVVSTNDEDKIIISYKMKHNGTIQSEWQYEDNVFLSKDALIQKLLLDEAGL